MALREAFLTPDLTKIHFRMLCREVGLSHLAVVENKLRFSEQPNGKIFVPALMTTQEFNRFRVKLEKTTYQVVLLLQETVVNAPLKTIKVATLPQLAEALTKGAASQGIELPRPLSQETGAFARLANVAMGNSVLHKTQTALYRVPKEDRAFAQTAVYAFLAGATDTIGRAADFGFLLALVSQPELQNLRKAALLAKKTSVEEAATALNVDKFDLNYLFSRLA